MRYEQFEVDVDEHEGYVFIKQDCFDSADQDVVKLSLQQIPMFIDVLRQAIASDKRAE